MTGNAEDAADLAQETYLRAFAAIGDFEGRSSVKTWLLRIATTEALQARRRAQTARRHLENKARLDSADESAARDSAATWLDVSAALSALKDDDRLILLLRYDQGMDYREIAAALDCAEGTVASRLNRARAKLREVLGEDYSNREEFGRAEHPRNGNGDPRGASPDLRGALPDARVESNERAKR